MVTGKRPGEPTKPRQAPKTGSKKKDGNMVSLRGDATTATPNQSQPTAPVTSETPPSIGHNIGEMTPEHKLALEYRHAKELKAVKEEVAKANGKMRAVRKRIKAEGGVLSKIEKRIKSETPEGRLELFAEAQEIAEVVNSDAYATQIHLDLDAESRVSPIEKARREGQTAYLKKEACTGGRWAPGSPEHQVWIEEWHNLAAKRIHEGGPTPLETAIEETEPAANGDGMPTNAEIAEVVVDSVTEAIAMIEEIARIEDTAPDPDAEEMLPPDTLDGPTSILHGEDGGPTFQTE